MTVITARGADSAEAMDEVIRRLGVNAFILSTTVRDGMVEIKAATEVPGQETKPRFAPDPAEPAPETMADRAKRFSDLLEARSDWAPVPVLRPAVPPRRTPWSRVSQQEQNKALLDRLERDLLAADPLPVGQLMPRTIIIGAPGSGKSLLAVRLAAAALLADRTLSPRILAPRMSNPLSDDRLRGWSRLLGILPERPLIGDVLQADGPHAVQAGEPVIFDMSDVTGATPELVAVLAGPVPTEIVLALPTGLSLRRTLREVALWAPLSPRLCLTFCDHAGPDRVQMTALADLGVRLSRAAKGSGVVESISVPDRADLARWLQEEADDKEQENAEAGA